MTDLIKKEGVGFFGQKMTSIEVAELTGKLHKDIMKSIRKLIKQKVIGRRNFALSSYTNAQNKEQPMYELDHDATMTLITGYDAKRRMAVIKRWRELEEGKAQPMVEKLSEAEVMARGLLAAKNMIDEKDRLLAEAKPKVELHDAIKAAQRTYSFAEVAKMVSNAGTYTIGRNHLMAFLRHLKVLMITNEPYQSFVDRQFFIIDIIMVNPGMVKRQTKVMADGLEWMARAMRKNFDDKGITGKITPGLWLSS